MFLVYALRRSLLFGGHCSSGTRRNWSSLNSRIVNNWLPLIDTNQHILFCFGMDHLFCGRPKLIEFNLSLNARWMKSQWEKRNWDAKSRPINLNWECFSKTVSDNWYRVGVDSIMTRIICKKNIWAKMSWQPSQITWRIRTKFQLLTIFRI